MTYAKSGLFWSQCFPPSLVIRKPGTGGRGQIEPGPPVIIATRLLQVVNSLFQTCRQLGTSSANTTC